MDKLLLIDDEADVQYSFRRIFDSPQMEITTASSGEEGLRLIPKLNPDLVMMDVRMGGLSGLETLRRLRQTDAKLPVIIMTAYGTTQTAIEAMKLGAYDYVLKPFDVPKLKALVATALEASRAMKKVVSYQPLLESEDYDIGIVGRTEGMQDVFKLIGQLAVSNATALITGESGTGKELIARAIYGHSQRSEKPFLAINCAAIPENLLESELFGHEKGAFTGALNQRKGRLEFADGGTVFLDEIGELSPGLQTKLLRVLQEREFERVGGNKPIKVDIRVIAATNQDLNAAIANGSFRHDLFFRLNVVELKMPALRNRVEDIPMLANYFAAKYADKCNRRVVGISPAAQKLLQTYDWPGNVRELENAVERAVVMGSTEHILSEDLPEPLLEAAAPHSPSPPTGYHDHVTTTKKEIIIEAMKKSDGSFTEAAKLLGLHPNYLHRLVKNLNLKSHLK
ncbi:MAG TPA: sigma-54 dependent transcriptional regulator [Pyrinomonadaceae bacterium]|nr:sigma-54 dependent transcriptional regulator [Pyrinomonadaceae bacterium]